MDGSADWRTTQVVERLGQVHVEEEWLRDDAVVLQLSGYIQNRESQALRRRIRDARERGALSVIVDMRGVEYISSAGMGVLIMLTKEMREATGRESVVVFGMREKHRAVLETLGVLQLLALTMTRGQALERLGLKQPEVKPLRMGVVADSHGNVDMLRSVCGHLLQELQVSFVAHLGDDLSDADVLDDFPVEKIAVPGVYHKAYADSEVPNRIIRPFYGFATLFSHTPSRHKNDLPTDPDPDDLIEQGLVDVFCHGHTHVPALRVRKHTLVVNPGNLRDGDKKHRPSYAVLQYESDRVTATLYDAGSNKKTKSLAHRRR